MHIIQKKGNLSRQIPPLFEMFKNAAKLIKKFFYAVYASRHKPSQRPN